MACGSWLGAVHELMLRHTTTPSKKKTFCLWLDLVCARGDSSFLFRVHGRGRATRDLGLMEGWKGSTITGLGFGSQKAVEAHDRGHSWDRVGFLFKDHNAPTPKYSVIL